MMLVSTFNIWLLVLVGCFWVAFPPRGQVTQRDVGLINLIGGALGTIIALMLRSTSLNGQLVESLEFSSTIVNETQYWLFFGVAIILAIVTFIDAIMYFQQRVTDNE